MVSIKIKKIKNKEYLYAEHSFRLPNGNIIKTSKLVKDKKDAEKKETKDYFLKEKIEKYGEYALKNYKPDSVINKDKIVRIERMRVEYKQILKSMTKNQLKDVLDRFTINFTYETNAIEGNSLTLKDVTLLLSENILPMGKELREVYETRNTRKANELLFSNKIKITKEGIIKLHEELIKDTGVNKGFKKIPNYLLMRNVKTTPPEKVEEEIDKLIEWYNKAKGKEHPLLIATHFHGRFEKIHPFEDGNGRAGRMLINAILIDQYYPPIIIRKSRRQSYFSALEAYDQEYHLKFERFLLDKMQDTFKKFFEEYVKYV